MAPRRLPLRKFGEWTGLAPGATRIRANLKRPRSQRRIAARSLNNRILAPYADIQPKK